MIRGIQEVNTKLRLSVCKKVISVTVTYKRTFLGFQDTLR
jgi:hypothetical protein